MRKRHPPKPSEPSSTDTTNVVVDKEVESDVRRSGKAMFSMLVLITYLSSSVYNFQHSNLPHPLTAKQAGKRGFSEIEAMKHVQALTRFGPHPVSSDSLLHALEYVLESVEKIKETAHWEVDVNIDFFQSKSGASGGIFKGKSLVYSDLSHVVLRILPKYESDAGDNAILVSSHIDTVFSTGGAGDCSSCVAVMLELARSVSQSAHGFKNSIIFLFNTGEEEGLNGAHSFITQHPWSSTVRLAIDLEAMGTGGKSAVFQAGPSPWAIENFALAAKYPSGHIIGQDLFSSGVINSATDFQVYKEVAGLSGLDFAFTDNTAVYHTKNDKIELIKPGSLQHLGENMLAFLLRIASSADLPKDKTLEGEEKPNLDSAVYFDILGKYMIVYRQSFATMLYVSVIMQSVLIWVMSLFMGGYVAIVSLVLSCLSIILAWTFSVAFSVAIAFILPLISSSPVPYASNPWMAVGLFVSPAILGSISGQHVAFILLRKEFLKGNSNKWQASLRIRYNLAKLEAERWLFKAGFIQWLVLLALGTYYKLGSTYLALVWLAPPVFAYGLLEATLTPIRLPKPLKLATLLISLAIPILVSSGSFIRLAGTLIGMLVRFDRNPGGTPEWLGNVMIAAVIATFISLTMVYLLAYIHLSGAKKSIVTVLCIITALSLVLASSGVLPTFTEDTARAVNVVHVVDTNGQEEVSFVSLFSYTPGNLNKEAEQMKEEGFICGRENKIDFVSFEAAYSCMTNKDAEVGWDKQDIPILRVINEDERRVKVVSIETGGSTRWTLGIDMEETEDFTLQVDEELLIERGNKSSNKEGWHQIQFSGGKKAPTRFMIKLYGKEKEEVSDETKKKEERPLLKLRTDFNRITPQVERVLQRLPPSCALFGKSTSPFTLAFLASLPYTK